MRSNSLARVESQAHNPNKGTFFFGIMKILRCFLMNNFPITHTPTIHRIQNIAYSTDRRRREQSKRRRVGVIEDWQCWELATENSFSKATIHNAVNCAAIAYPKPRADNSAKSPPVEGDLPNHQRPPHSKLTRNYKHHRTRPTAADESRASGGG